MLQLLMLPVVLIAAAATALVGSAGASSISMSAEQATRCTLGKPGVGIGSGGIGTKQAASAAACCDACDAATGCVAFTWEPPSGVCYLKDNVKAGKCSSPKCISGANGKKPSPHPPSPPHPPHHPPGPPKPLTPPAPPAAEQLKDLATLRKRFFNFYLNFGDCTQTQFCMEVRPTTFRADYLPPSLSLSPHRRGPQGSYMLVQDGSKGTCGVTCADSTHFLSTISPNGTWPDVNYQDKTHAKWKTMLHPDRLLSMIRSYHCPACAALYKDSAALAKVHLGLDWWFQARPKPSQWWWADIGQPDVVGAVMMLLGDDATPQELNATNSMLVGKGVPTGTGENVVWELQVAINRASLSNDTANAWQAFANMWSALITNPGEGVQSDGSFHFHGNILYSGGYGADCECDAFSNVCT